MTADQFRAIRRRLGLTQSQLAARLRIADARTIRRYEGGKVPITGPVSVLMELWAREVQL